MFAPISTISVRPKVLVLFDLDGVLWDSRENMARSWAAVQERFGVTVPFEDYFREIGQPFPAIMKRLGIEEHTSDIEATYRVASMAHIASAKFYDGAAELLVSLQAAGLKLGVVTSKDMLRTSAILAMVPVTFDVVRTPNDAVRGKPAPDHLLAAMVQVGVDPADTIYIGDMDSDFEAAVRANVDYVHAAWGYGEVPPGCRHVAGALSDLTELSAARKRA